MTPESRLQKARDRVSRAWEACPHWDYESDGEPSAGHECCREIRAARAEVRAARKALEKAK